MHGHCDTRPTATFQAAGHHGQYQILLIVDRGTCWHVCKQLAQGCYLKVQGGKLNPWPLSRQYNALTITGLILSSSSTKPKCTTALCNGNILIQQYGEVCCRLMELLHSVQTSVAVFECWSWSPGASRPLLGSLGLGHWCWSHVCGPGIDSTGLGLGPAYITGALTRVLSRSSRCSSVVCSVMSSTASRSRSASYFSTCFSLSRWALVIIAFLYRSSSSYSSLCTNNNFSFTRVTLCCYSTLGTVPKRKQVIREFWQKATSQGDALPALKLQLPIGRSGPHTWHMVPWYHPSPQPTWHLHWFSRFITAHCCDQGTHADTHTHSPRNITNNRPHLCTVCMWCSLTTLIQWPLSRKTWVSRQQKGKWFWILMKQQITGMASAGPHTSQIKSASCPRQTTTPISHHSFL